MDIKQFTNKQPAGLTRFINFLDPFSGILRKAAVSTNPALYLFKNDARTILFRLEALARIYRTLHNKKLFNSLNDDFKLLEDHLGKIDFYDGFLIEFSKEKKLPASFLRYFTKRIADSTNELNTLLKRNSWLSESPDKIEIIKNNLEKADWLNNDSERKVIGEFIIDQINKFTKQYESGELNFNTIEDGVHSFRRKLRWLSIYAASLNGLIQIKKVKVPDPQLLKYLTPEVINSPYNVLPEQIKQITPLLIQSVNFYALSRIINITGIMKDDGLRSQVINKGLIESDLKSKDSIKAIKETLTARSKYRVNEIPEHAEQLADDFIYKDRIMERIKRDISRSLIN